MATVICKVCDKGFEVPAYAVGRRKMCSDVCRALNQRYVSMEGMKRYRATEAGKAAYTEYNKRYKVVKHD